MKKIIKLFYCLILINTIILVTSCEDKPKIIPRNTGIYAAEVNKNPQFFMTVDGFIDPALEGKVPLRIFATYCTSNPDCDYWTNKFEGVKTYRDIITEERMKPDKEGKFKYKIPLDLYKPGYCKWNICAVTYLRDDKSPEYNSYTIADFSSTYLDDNKKPKYESYTIGDFFNPQTSEKVHKKGFYNYSCFEDGRCVIVQDDLGHYLGHNLSPNQDYSFTINLRKNNAINY